ncbi:MAG: hypothetical protein AAB738_01690 [Patescibacteria group bacterium]
MKKIFVSKNDGVAEVVDKIISESDSEITLVVPRNTLLDESISNFHLIKREADSAGKRISVESVDEKILTYAKASQLDAVHPILKKRKSVSLSDIIPKNEDKEEEEELKKEEARISSSPFFSKGSKNKKAEEVEVEDHFFKSREEELPAKTPSHRRKFQSSKKLLWIFSILVIIVAGVFVLNSFKKAEVVINFNAIPFNFQGRLLASARIVKNSSTSSDFPAEVFTEPKNLTQLFPASSRKNVSDKATGKIVVYNAFSSQPQGLVATTRFVTPDGKIFRLDSSITVPGAEIKDGKIIPASIEAAITADKAGSTYNLGPIEKLTIPGFKGSAKYEKFYGSLVKTSGGFIGERAFPTDKDITSAKIKLTETLSSSLNSDLALGNPKGFKIIDGASEIKIVRISVNKATDSSGNFSVFGEAERKAIGFKEEDLRGLLLSQAQNDNPGTIFKSINLAYKDSKPDFAKGELGFTVVVDGILTQDFNVDDFKAKILSRSIEETRSFIKELKGLKDAKVSLWPTWLGELPSNPEKIKITID